MILHIPTDLSPDVRTALAEHGLAIQPTIHKGEQRHVVVKSVRCECGGPALSTGICRRCLELSGKDYGREYEAGEIIQRRHREP